MTEARGELLVLAAWAALIASVAHFLARNASWLRLFGRDLVRWLRHPEIAGGWTEPAGWPLALAFAALALATGWMIASAILRRTDLARDLQARAGLALVLAACLAGYAGMVAVVFGRLEAVTLWALMGVAGAVSLLVFLADVLMARGAARGSSDPPASRREPPHRLALIGLPFATAVALLCLTHSALAPVTEWDAIVYHAATAKVWFLTRPSPPVLAGPSVGIEISINYPPLFTAIGAALYTAAGHFADLYLRLVSPLVLVGLLLVAKAYARVRFGRYAAWWTVIMLLGSPLVVLYAVWPTGYMLLAALTLIVLILCQSAASRGSLAGWLVAGSVAGLAMLTHFYGWLTLGFAIAAVVIWQRSRRGLVGLAVFWVAAILVASPWLIRNLVLLHDPVYPLGAPIFHGVDLSQPLWQATQAEIRQNALGQFGTAHGLRLLVAEVAGTVGSHYLLPIGLAMGLMVGSWRALSGDRMASYLSLTLVFLLGVLLTPRWYWLRALLQVTPPAAILAGLAVREVTTRVQRLALGGWGRVARGLWASTLVAVILTATVTGGALAVSGPNQESWTTNLLSSNDVMGAVRNLGSDQKQLWTVYGGDYLCWQWLSSRLGPREKVATFDVRLYYMTRPDSFFYLDGQEAIPLLGMRTPQAVRAYLVAQGVHHIMIPAWAVAPTPSRHPSADLLPLVTMLGKPGGFPLEAVFAPTGGPWPTAVYGVSGEQGPVAPALWPGSGAPIPNPDQLDYSVRHDQTDPRIIAPILGDAPSALEFVYDDSSAGPFELNLYDYATHTWHFRVYRAVRTGRQALVSATVPLPRSLATHLPGVRFVLVGVFSARNDLSLSNLTVVQQAV